MEARVRPARPTDKKPLMSFIKDVWGGHDYIPLVWDKWLTDPSGRMFVVEADRKVVGMNRVKFLEDGSAWFEGARVHPDYRGRGLASMLGENSMKVARQRGVRVFRLTSGSTNKAAHRQIARIRFREAARFSVYEPRKGMKLTPGPGAERASPQELRSTLRTLRDTKEFALGRGVEWHDFGAVALTPGVVARRLSEGAVWRSGGAVAVVQEGGEGGGRWEEVSFLGGPAEDASALVKSLVGRNRKATERYVFVPQKSPLIHMLRLSGFVRNFSMVLFERRAAKG
jgi:GNAT superfamily N-acetyltransferase